MSAPKINSEYLARAEYFKNASRKMSDIEYIVIHGTGMVAPAVNFCKSLHNNKGMRAASFHYVVGEDEEVFQAVLDEDVAWHCGGGPHSQDTKSGKHYKYSSRARSCTNTNSIGIEQAFTFDSKKRNIISAETRANCINLVAWLMDKYDIPIERVVRHFDVTGKLCPGPTVSPWYGNPKTNKAWQAFLRDLKVELAAYKETATPKTEAKSGKKALFKVKLTANVNYRKGPGTTYAVRKTLKKGKNYNVFATKGKWYQLSGGGWIYKKYTKKV
jgi:N-acetylmuramoyl-L-alanine amidase CwlA